MFASQHVSSAYSVLGLEEGCSLEVVKTAYKKAALRSHPDKNPDNPEATVEFQRIGEAYRVLSKHLTQPQGGPRGFSGFGGFGGYGGDSDYDGYDDWDDDDDDDFGPAYFMWMFESLFNSGRFYAPRSEFRQFHVDTETPAQYKARIERQRREQIEAQERREREARLERERKQREREEARVASEIRQKEKLEAKRLKAENDRRKAEQAAQKAAQKAQRLRSAVFAAARSGNAAKVKQGVWEEGVDASGGEVKAGCEAYVKMRPKDMKETLLHLACRNGDLDLVKWLESHGADMEERNTQGLSALDLALKLGKVSIVEYLFGEFTPDDSPGLYKRPTANPTTFLALAVQSGEPEIVWMTLEKKLASAEEIHKIWSKAVSAKAKPQAISGEAQEKQDDILKLLMQYGGFTPPATPQAKKAPSASGSLPEVATNPKPRPAQRQPRGQQAPAPAPPSSQTNTVPTSQQKVHQHQSPQNGRGFGRGRGQGRGRGRGRGFAQGPA